MDVPVVDGSHRMRVLVHGWVPQWLMWGTLCRVEVKAWLKSLGVDKMESAGADTLVVDFTQLEPLPRYQRRSQKVSAHVKVPVAEHPPVNP